MDLIFQLHQLVAEWNVFGLVLLGYVAGQVQRLQNLARERAIAQAKQSFQASGIYPYPGQYSHFDNKYNFDPFMQFYFNRTESNLVDHLTWPGTQFVFSATPDAVLPPAQAPARGWAAWVRVIRPRDPSRAWVAQTIPPDSWSSCGDFLSCYGQGIVAVASLGLAVAAPILAPAVESVAPATPVAETASVVTDVAAPTALTATLPEGSAVLAAGETVAAAEPIVSLGPTAELTATIPEGQLALLSSQAAMVPAPLVIPGSTLTATLPEGQIAIGGVTPTPAPAPPTVPSTPSPPSQLAQQAQKVVTNVATGQATRLVQQGIYDLTRSEPVLPIGFSPAPAPDPALGPITTVAFAGLVLYVLVKFVIGREIWTA